MTRLYPYDPETFAELLVEADAVEAAVRESVQEALSMHKRLGHAVVAWRNGQVVWVPAAEIPLNGDSAR